MGTSMGAARYTLPLCVVNPPDRGYPNGCLHLGGLQTLLDARRSGTSGGDGSADQQLDAMEPFPRVSVQQGSDSVDARGAV